MLDFVNKLALEDVLVAPVAKNLISVAKLNEKSIGIEIKNKTKTMKDVKGKNVTTVK